VTATLHNNGATSPPAIVTVATYAVNPIAGTPLWAGGFFDVKVTGADAADSADLAFYYPTTLTPAEETALFLQYWIGNDWVPVVGSGGAAPVKNTTNNLDGTVSGGRITVTLDASSVPSLLDLSGTIFALATTDGGPAPPTTTATTDVQPNASGWFNTAVVVTLTATGGAGVATEFNLDGLGWAPYTAPFKVRDEGVHTISFRSRDGAGSVEPDRTLVLRIDRSHPTVIVTVTPAVLAPADGGLVDVVVDVSVTDNLSGAGGFVLKALGSSVPEKRGGPADIVGWTLGTPDVSGRLRASLAPDGGRRTYSLTYEVQDAAGNGVRVTKDVAVSR
jgi:hypothetical protein